MWLQICSRTSFATRRVQLIHCHGKFRNAYFHSSRNIHQRMRRREDSGTEMPAASTTLSLRNFSTGKLVLAENAGTQREDTTTEESKIGSETSIEKYLATRSSQNRVKKVLSAGQLSAAESDTDMSYSKNFEGFLWRTQHTRLLNAAPELSTKVTPVWDGSTLKANIARGDNLCDRLRYSSSEVTV